MKTPAAAAILTFLTCTVDAGPLAAVSYNIRNDNAGDTGVKDWQARKDAVASYLKDSSASIIGLQEVRHNQLEDIASRLPGHGFIGVGRIDGKTEGEYAPIFYETAQWKIDPEENGTLWLSDTPTVPNSNTWGAAHPRIFTWARLIGIGESTKDTAVYVYNTHWDHVSQPAREKSANQLVATLKNRNHPDDPAILMGDFNATTGNPAIETILSSGLVIDPGKRQFKSSSKWSRELVDGFRIDHIFITPALAPAVASVESDPGVGEAAASDHHPIKLDGPPDEAE